MIATLPTKAASKTAIEVLTQEDLAGLLIATADKGGWKLGDKPFGMFASRLLYIYIYISIYSEPAKPLHA